MTGGEYLVAVLATAATVVPVVAAGATVAWRWRGNDDLGIRLLVLAVLVLLHLTLLGELLGTLGWLRRGPLVAAAVVSAVVVLTAARRRWPVRARGSDPGRLPLDDRVVVAVGIGLALFPYLTLARTALAFGPLGFDTTSHHLPWALRFFQTGTTTSVHDVLYGLSTNFDPAGNSLLHALGMVLTGRDVLSPALSLLWPVLLLLAAASLDADARRRVPGVLGAALVLALPIVWRTQGGSALSDLTAMALLLVGVALLRRFPGDVAMVGVAGAALGLSLGAKLSAAVPVALLVVAVAATAPAAARARATASLVLGTVVAGGYWFLRDLVATGSPVPAIDLGIGPLRFPRPALSGNDGDHFTLGHYLLDADVLSDRVVPAIRDAFGPATVALLLLVVGAAGVLLLARGGRFDRWIGLTSLLSVAAYLVTPGTAVGPDGAPVELLIRENTRVLLPAFVLALPLCATRVTPLAGTARRVVLGGALLVVGASVLAGDPPTHIDWSELPFLRTGAVAAVSIGVVVLVATGRSARARLRRPISPAAAAGLSAAAALVVVGLGYRSARHHDAEWYVRGGFNELDAATAWARTVSGVTIATNGAPWSYELAGPTLSNRVQAVGHEGPHGEFEAARSCAEWRQGLLDEDADYAVLITYGQRAVPRELEWTGGPDADVVASDGAGNGVVVRLDGSLDPASCPDGSG